MEAPPAEAGWRLSASHLHWTGQAASPPAPADFARRHHAGERRLAQCLMPSGANGLRDGSAVDLLGAVARFDETALGFECRDVGAREFLRNLLERLAASGQTVDQALVDGLSLTI